MTNILTTNPATERRLESFVTHSHAEVSLRLEEVVAGQRDWSLTTPPDRAVALAELAAILERASGSLAQLVVAEMGKPLRQADAEVAKCVDTIRWYAEKVGELAQKRVIDGSSGPVEIRTAPLGVILAVMPWNYPIWQVVRAGIPAIAAGNAILLKHASNVSGSALLLEDVFEQWRPGLLKAVLIRSTQVGEIIADSRVAGVSLTGGDVAGRAVGAAAGAALKPSVLELGGSDPFVVLPTADLASTVRSAVWARFQNNGQSCIAAKRFIVHRDVGRDFAEAFAAAVDELVVGDPTQAGVDLGPVASQEARDELAAIVQATLDAGAKLATRQRELPDHGWYVSPTLVLDPPHGSAVLKQETFGPVASLEIVDSVDQAIERANDTPFGLGASIWTEDTELASRVADELHVGTVSINKPTASDPRVPIGGIKDSGFGRELGDLGFYEFTNQKSVLVNESVR